MDSFRDKVAVITGAASGIGLALARALAFEGAKIVLCDRNEERLAEAVTEIGWLGCRIVGVLADVADRESVNALAEKSFAAFDIVHLLFNNAGAATSGTIDSLTDEDWNGGLSINLWGAINGIQAFLPHMLAHGEPAHIVNTAAFAGLVPLPQFGPYNVAKAGVIALTETMREDLRGRNVGASVLCPIRVSTRFWQPSLEVKRAAQHSMATSESHSPHDRTEVANEILYADEVAPLVLAAIRNNSLFILPNSDSLSQIRNRYAKIHGDFTDRQVGVEALIAQR